ncbi:MAG: galactose-1-phosphate uridylyltransferase [Fimbriimonadales bacterium]
MSELRRHPFLGEWVVTATHRQDRTFFPPPDYCPLCPTKPGGHATEIPFPDYEIAVFENKFPSFASPPPEHNPEAFDFFSSAPSTGVCEVICYSSDHTLTFAGLGKKRILQVCEVWKERYTELIAREDVEYVFIFENKGSEMGVTLTHPHGQIYGYPFVPEVCERRMANERKHYAETNEQLCETWLREELADRRRIVFREKGWVAVVPYFARYPYEVHLLPEKRLACLADFDVSDLEGLATGLDRLTRTYDSLFGISLPYIMGFYQHPDPATRFVAQFTPPHRTADKLKYLAGSEAVCGVFIVDALPEDTASALRNATEAV